MKFKLESNSTVQDLVVEDIASVEELMNTLDTSSLDQAFEELNDLQMLQQNIEKFGITEPVMDLVGGTLQSMDIRIDDKDACLEGLGDAIKTAGKAVYEFVKKILDKIVTAIKTILGVYTRERLRKVETLLQKAKNFVFDQPAYNVPTKDVLQRLIDDLRFLGGFDDKDPKLMARYVLDVIHQTEDGSFEIDGEIERTMEIRADYKAKGYRYPSEVVKFALFLADSLDSCRDNVEKMKKRLDNIEDIPKGGKADLGFIKGGPQAMLYTGEDPKIYAAYLRAYVPCLAKLVSISTRIYMALTSYAFFILTRVEDVVDEK